MLDLKCVYCPARGQVSSMCLKLDETGEVKLGSEGERVSCETAISTCDLQYSDLEAIPRKSLLREVAHIRMVGSC